MKVKVVYVVLEAQYQASLSAGEIGGDRRDRVHSIKGQSTQLLQFGSCKVQLGNRPRCQQAVLHSEDRMQQFFHIT